MRFSSMLVTAAAAIAIVAPAQAYAHCDGLDGPVVAAARKALQSGDPNPVLIWVQPKDETEIRHALDEAVAVRRLNSQAREMADRYFFETLVRVHRAGEGAPYTGLKPAGRDLGPAIPLADKTVASGSDRELLAFTSKAVQQGIRVRFANLQKRRNFQPADLAAGREYIASYVTFVHYIEGLHQATESGAAGHYPDGEPAPAAHHE